MRPFIQYICLIVILLVNVQSLRSQQAPFELPPLPYGYNALEPAIDARTMEIHHGKHHAAYVKNLNAALKGSEFEGWSLDELLLYAGETTDAVRNNAGGHYNHTLFWNILSLSAPFDANSEVGRAVVATFGSVDSLNRLLGKAGSARFGSGWAWLSVTPEGKLVVSSTPNQDNPIMDVVPERGIPVLGIDVWEHAYYLRYQNRRGEYLGAVLSAVNWEAVDRNYRNALKSDLLLTLARETWSELKAFHAVMAATFHPAEEGDFEPIRRRAPEMQERAEALQKGIIPAPFNTPAVRTTLGELARGAADLSARAAEKASDKVLMAKLTALHDLFHTLQGECRHHGVQP